MGTVVVVAAKISSDSVHVKSGTVMYRYRHAPVGMAWHGGHAIPHASSA